MVKRSPVELLHAGTVQPGKYLILVGGGTAEVEESYREGMQAAPAEILDEVFLPQVHPRVVEALDGDRAFKDYESLVVLETSTIAAIVRATDAAAKGAQVEVAELRLGNGLGGRGLAILTGERTDVEAAAEIADAMPRRPKRDVVPFDHLERARAVCRATGRIKPIFRRKVSQLRTTRFASRRA